MKFTILFLFFVLPFTFADLRIGFYSYSCPTVENIVYEAVQKSFDQDKSITPALLRMHFHDCFVRGCDASILIDSTKENASEKDAGPNKSIRGFGLIDDIKRSLEEACPSTVSCADIITLATRDAVALAGGPKYDVPTGRRDGLVSNASEVNLPGPEFSVSEAAKAFAAKDMTLNEMVTLLGAHTVGYTHCSLVEYRLNDPIMDPDLRAKLVKKCANFSKFNDPVLSLENTTLVFDNQFYNQMLLKRGVLYLDQQLALDPSSKDLVSTYAQNGMIFFQRFVDAVVKMGRIDVLVGNDGEIRKNCRVFNSYS